MTKWFDTNYHYLVPEIGPETNFALTSNRIVEEFEYALANGVETRPYIVGPVTFLLLSKASDDAPAGFSPLSRLEDVLPVYAALLRSWPPPVPAGSSWTSPPWSWTRTPPPQEIQAAVARSYEVLAAAADRPQLFVSTPYGALNGQLGTLAATNIDALHLDVFKGAVPSAAALAALGNKTLVAGVVDGHNIWRNDLAGLREQDRRAAEERRQAGHQHLHLHPARPARRRRGSPALRAAAQLAGLRRPEGR